MTPAERAQTMPHEVHDTVNAYLAGKIDRRLDGLWLYPAGSAQTAAHHQWLGEV